MLLRTLILVVLSAGLAGCLAIDLPEGSYAARGGLGATAERVADRIRVCWFQSGDATFAAYRQETEISSLSGQPRILIVDRDDRGGLPQLVVTIRSVRGAGTVVSSFGPLTETALLTRINSDLDRWAGGSRNCNLPS